jgi:hypothetical protein
MTELDTNIELLKEVNAASTEAYPIMTEAFTGTWLSLESKCRVSSISKPELVVFS